MTTPLSDYIATLITKKGWTQIQAAEKVGTTKQKFNDVLEGRRKIPKKAKELWADGLELDGKDREEFIELVLLAHSPEEIQRLVARLRAGAPKG